MNRQALFAKKETAYGTPAALTAADVIHAENVRYTPKGEIVKGDPAKPGFGSIPGVVYGEHGELTFDEPLAGSGTPGTAPKWGLFMKAVGWTETVVATTSVTYALGLPPQADSLTFRWRDAKRTHVLAGARGLDRGGRQRPFHRRAAPGERRTAGRHRPVGQGEGRDARPGRLQPGEQMAVERHRGGRLGP